MIMQSLVNCKKKCYTLFTEAKDKSLFGLRREGKHAFHGG